MPDEYVLAGDLGGTNLRLAAVARDGEILHQVNAPTPKTRSADDVLHAIIGAVESCLHGLGSSQSPQGFGLALAALVNFRQGKILSSPNLPELNDLPLAEILAKSLQLKVVLENDATAAAIGEHWLGSSKSVENSVFVTLGTGVGGGLILEGRPYRGSDGTAGEIGHICVEPEGLQCGCGNRGCVEQYSSATAIVRIAREQIAGGRSSKLTGSDFSAKDVFDAAVANDSVAIEAFRVMGSRLGIALADLVDVLNPDLIVIGGGAAGGWDFFIDHARIEINERAFRHPAQTVQLVRASLGNSAGILGAARVIQDSI